MEINLLVSYDPKAGYMGGRGEVHNVLVKLGDQKAEMQLLVPGIIGVATKLRNRDVVEEVREAFVSNPSFLNSTLKWVPVDFWCAGSLEAIVQIVKEDFKDMFAPSDQYAIEVVKHRSDLHKEQVIEAVAPLLKGKVNLDFPQKILRIELFGETASITLLKPKDVFSVAGAE